MAPNSKPATKADKPVIVLPSNAPVDLFTTLKGEPRAGDLALVWPEFLDRNVTMLERCRKRGALYFAERGTATMAEQAQLHALYLGGRGGKAAPAGESIHNFGGGLDYTADAEPSKAGLQPTWKPEAYSILIEEARRVELLSGVSFGDSPHVQIPRYVRGRDMLPMLRVYNSTKGTEIEKLRAVWAWLKLPENYPFARAAIA